METTHRIRKLIVGAGMAVALLIGLGSPAGAVRLPQPRHWHRVDAQLADALAEGDAPDAWTRDWEACRWRHLPHGRIVVACPDGWVEVD